MRRYGLTLLVFLVPSFSRAADMPERLLSADTQIYLRWDGSAAHKAAFEKTALSIVIQKECAEFIASVKSALQGALSDKNSDIVKLAEAFAQKGLVLGVEVRGIEPPDAQATVILPGGGKGNPLLAIVRLAAQQARLEVKEAKVGGRTIYHVEGPTVHAVCWVEGTDAVIVVGTQPPDTVLTRIKSQKLLTDSPRFHKVQDFKEFRTAARGFVDLAALLKFPRSANAEAGKVLDDLGLSGLGDLTFFAGFSGAAIHTLVALEAPSPRNGLLRLTAGKSFTLKDVPALPPDLIGFSALRFDAAMAYDTVLEAVENLAPPVERRRVQEAVQKANQALGINIRDDLLGSLGDLLVTYSSHAEGPMFLGQTVLIQVKDAQKLQAALDRMVQSLAKLAGSKVRVNERSYHGAEVRAIHVEQPGFIIVPTYAISNGWLVAGFYPQPVQGYLLRAGRELPAWQPEKQLTATLDRLPTDFTLLSISDPRPTTRQLLALAPLIAGALASSVPGVNFDVETLPNAYLVTRHLFPNVTVGSDDGKTLRFQTVVSLPVPPFLESVDSTVLVSIAAITTLGKKAQATSPAQGEGVAGHPGQQR
jgi:hypothetical protein